MCPQFGYPNKLGRSVSLSIPFDALSEISLPHPDDGVNGVIDSAVHLLPNKVYPAFLVYAPQGEDQKGKQRSPPRRRGRPSLKFFFEDYPSSTTAEATPYPFPPSAPISLANEVRATEAFPTINRSFMNKPSAPPFTMIAASKTVYAPKSDSTEHLTFSSEHNPPTLAIIDPAAPLLNLLVEAVIAMETDGSQCELTPEEHA